MKKINSVTNTEDRGTKVRLAGAKKPKKKMTKVDYILIIVAILLLLAAAGFFLYPIYNSKQREAITDDFLVKIDEGTATIIVDRDDYAIDGEEYETFQTYDSGETATPTVTLPEDVVLTALGVFQIDSVDIYLPLLDDAGTVPLRYGAGMLSGTAMPGQEGNFVVLGHRMKTYGLLFNRLGEVVLNDEIVITMLDGTVYTYVVDNIIPALDPAELSDYIGIDSGTGKQITLVTCTPTGVGSHRIIIIGHLREEE